MATAIGDYLRARRELVRPEDVGIPDLGRRRVPGLRRGELAMLAGISPEYLVRLEQGRNEHPSAQVLDALARALQLDDDATSHLHALAGPVPRSRRRPRRPEVAPASVVRLLHAWDAMPVIVEGRRMDVLAANPMAVALSPVFSPGVNIVRAVFLDPALRELVDDWETSARGAVANLRGRAGPDVDEPELAELVGELSVRSQDFREMWARHDVRPELGRGTTTFHHPQVGALELAYDKFPVPETGGQTLVVYHAEPDGRSARALSLLETLAAGTATSGEQAGHAARD